MTKEEFAHMMDGRDWSNPITSQEGDEAELSGLVVVYGDEHFAYFKGSINEDIEAGHHNLWYKRTIQFDAKGEFCKLTTRYTLPEEKNDIRVMVDEHNAAYEWVYYKTLIPHATFNLVRDGLQYCKGIVFEHSELTP